MRQMERSRAGNGLTVECWDSSQLLDRAAQCRAKGKAKGDHCVWHAQSKAWAWELWHMLLATHHALRKLRDVPHDSKGRATRWCAPCQYIHSLGAKSDKNKFTASKVRTYGFDFGIETVTSALKTAFGSPRSASVFAKLPIDRVTLP